MKQVANTGRKLLAILLMTAMVLSLGACGGGNSSSTTDIMPSSSEAESSSQSSSSSEESSSASVSMPTAAPESETVMEKLSEAYALNTDVVGWLYLPNTTVDDPVLLYNETMTVEDNQYYLRKNAVKEYDWYGCYFADFECTFDPLSTNTVIYGHNWTNYSADPKIGDPSDEMFAQLTAFQHLDFAKENLFIHFTTQEQSMTFKIFAAFYTEDTFPYYYPNLNTDEMMEMVASARERSEHDYDVLVDENDKLISLSTCTRRFGSTDRQRFVVMGRLLRQEEKATPYEVTANPDPVRPNL